MSEFEISFFTCEGSQYDNANWRRITWLRTDSEREAISVAADLRRGDPLHRMVKQLAITRIDYDAPRRTTVAGFL